MPREPRTRATKHNPLRLRGLTPKVVEHLPELRGNLTPQEEVLWDALRGRRLDGVKLRRQHPLGAFDLDFYAPELRLVVELDGSVHNDPIRKALDRRRDAHLTANGYHVVRITNMEVVLNLPAVLERLSTTVTDLRREVALTPDPSPDLDPGRGETAAPIAAHGDM